MVDRRGMNIDTGGGERGHGFFFYFFGGLFVCEIGKRRKGLNLMEAGLLVGKLGFFSFVCDFCERRGRVGIGIFSI